MPSKRIRVRRHERRKPKQEQRINVKEYERTLDMVAPKGHERDFIRARAAFNRRSPGSKVFDLNLAANEVGAIDEPGYLERWIHNINQMDLFGVDDTLYAPKLMDNRLVKEILLKRAGALKADVAETIHAVRVKVKKVAKQRIPVKEKVKAIRKIEKVAKQEIKQKIEAETKLVEKVVEAVKTIRTRASKPWSRERRKRANYVKDIVGCNVIQADSLIRRAKMNGVSYDLVDWDAIQGRDLEYSEWQRKLEEQVGETRTEDEFYNDIRAQKEAYDLQQEAIKAQAEEDLKEAVPDWAVGYGRRSQHHPDAYAYPDPY